MVQAAYPKNQKVVRPSTGLWVRTILLVLLLLLQLDLSAHTHRYFAKHNTTATALSLEYGIPSSVILAIGFIESSAGTGWAARQLHNHFGIVGKNKLPKNGKRKSRYKQYPNSTASYKDFCKLVSKKWFYKELKGSDNDTLWIVAISKAGYSEQPKVWQRRILSTIAKYDL